MDNLIAIFYCFRFSIAKTFADYYFGYFRDCKPSVLLVLITIIFDNYYI